MTRHLWPLMVWIWVVAAIQNVLTSDWDAALPCIAAAMYALLAWDYSTEVERP